MWRLRDGFAIALVVIVGLGWVAKELCQSALDGCVRFWRRVWSR